ncbi:MAG TPA: plastocyanin/azurin family copper-binding protein [Jiangellaceae bacterium]|nr:plastocyanin/azurin family copper-binding protein [Jiangellaceae bacterium]
MNPRPALAAAGTLLLALAACGGNGSTEEGGGTAASATSTSEGATGDATNEAGVSVATLIGTVGPGFTISLTQDGEPLSSLVPGTYTVEIDDQGSAHNFHLTGPGVDEATDVAGTGPTTWSLTLEDGTYEYVCDPHASTMNGRFTVG